jgi:hypothetical protein
MLILASMASTRSSASQPSSVASATSPALKTTSNRQPIASRLTTIE